jgi:DNA-binding response OmpR family regulator
MGKTINNDNESWVTTFKKGFYKIDKTIEDLKTPIDFSVYILKYGKISFNYDSGQLKFDNKNINLRQEDKIYKIFRSLIAVKGKEVLYKDLTKSLSLRNDTKSRKLISASVRDLRRRLGMSGKENTDRNIFIMTGKGIKLAFRS